TMDSRNNADALTLTYNARWLQELDATASVSAEQVVPIVVDLVQPQSVVDVGCGQGAWLRAFRRRGIADILGLDGPWIDQARLYFPADRFIALDVSEPVRLGRGFDLAVSLELAEHLRAEAAPTLIESLTTFAPVVLFSAAIPGQGGTGHVNEQWPDYWVS